jgi:hypothetical protein
VSQLFNNARNCLHNLTSHEKCSLGASVTATRDRSHQQLCLSAGGAIAAEAFELQQAGIMAQITSDLAAEHFDTNS